MGDAGLLQKVERRIMDLLPRGAAKAKVIATRLAVSERTPTRQLSAPGTASMTCSKGSVGNSH